VHVDVTAHFSTCSTFLSSGNRCNENLHSPDVGLHVDTTAHFSSSTLYSLPTTDYSMKTLMLLVAHHYSLS